MVIGFAAGRAPAIETNHLLRRNVSIVGVALGAFLGIDGQLIQRQTSSLNDMIANRFVDPQISETVAFGDIPEALARLELGAIQGKVVAVLS